ncbi:MAG: PP2C family protein-serine/threonine phosphatase [Actinomycetes bacterium]
MAILTGYNLSTHHGAAYQLIGGLAIVPLAAAVLIEKINRLVLIDALTLVSAFLTIDVTGVPYDTSQFARLGLITFSCGFGLWSARRRIHQSRRLVTLGQVARSAQQAIMRPVPPDMPGMDVEVRYLSSALEAQVGGDAYDAVETPFGFRALVADAKGKGLEAVRSAALVVGSFRAWALDEPDLSSLLRRLDRLARRDLAQGDFVTALVAELNGATFSFATAGHPPPLRFRHGTILELRTPPSPPLTLFHSDEVPTVGQVEISAGDTILMFSDGLSEARNDDGEFFPFSQLLAGILTRHPEIGLAESIDKLIDELRIFVHGQLTDDLVLVAVRLEQSAQPATATSDHGSDVARKAEHS